MRKYKQPYSLKEYDDIVRDRVHNALKHEMPLDRWKWYKSKWWRRKYETTHRD